MSATTTLHSVSVRPALPADEEALGELDRSTWSTLHAVMPRPRPPYDPFFDERHRPGDFLVAEAVTEAATEAGAPDGSGEIRIAGYIRLVPPTPLACNAHVRQIQGLAVGGLGARGRCRTDPAEGRVRRSEAPGRQPDHAAGARAQHPRPGALRLRGVRRGRVLSGEFFLHGRYVDDVLMGRSLAP